MLVVDAEVGYARGAGLQRVDLQLAAGDVLLVRGPNGVGKSTLLSTVAGLRPPLEGTVTVGGQPTTSTGARRRIGYAIDPPHLFEELTPREHLALARSLWESARVPVEGGASGAILEGTPDLSAGMLSLGQRKRLGLALALLHEPWLWVLDEPFNGLDEACARRLRAQMDRHVADGGAVLCATHDEAALGLPDVRVLELESRDRPAVAEGRSSLPGD